MDMFYKKIKCERCNTNFSKDIKRVQSWFTEDVICSNSCYIQESNLLEKLGNKKYQFEDCGYLPFDEVKEEPNNENPNTSLSYAHNL